MDGERRREREKEEREKGCSAVKGERETRDREIEGQRAILKAELKDAGLEPWSFSIRREREREGEAEPHLPSLDSALPSLSA